MEQPIDDLNNEIKRLQSEIDEIQDSCNHKEEKLEFVDGQKLRWVCVECKKPGRWPSQEETQNFLK